ncbi:unnamed protein product [Schistocephalus solidus]|uniref:Endo/exonuclease/phosphatase domain-containing protein n=1 Tax=Schistocephalus solidus TaxID=70667 RepID=A0A183SJZ2_SCHSO|nr:unnamed protein product [Schistocephalus solidus]
MVSVTATKTAFSFCERVRSTFFCLPMWQKVAWMHPRPRPWHLLDYVLVRRRDPQDVPVTKAIPGADGWTDHHLVNSKMRLRLQPCTRPQMLETVQSNTLDVLGRVRCQKQHWFDENDAAINALLAEKN